MSPSSPPIIDYSAMIHAARDARAEMIHQLVAPYVNGVFSAAQVAGLIALGLLVIISLIAGLRTGQFMPALAGIAASTLLSLGLMHFLSITTFTWASAGTGVAVIAFCVLGGWRVTRRVLNLLV